MTREERESYMDRFVKNGFGTREQAAEAWEDEGDGDPAPEPPPPPPSSRPKRPGRRVELPTGCPAKLEIIVNGRHSGWTPCTLPFGHGEALHHARWRESTNDEREVDFDERYQYDVRAREFLVTTLAPTSRPEPQAVQSAATGERIRTPPKPAPPVTVLKETVHVPEGHSVVGLPATGGYAIVPGEAAILTRPELAIRHLPLALIDESPLNYRKTFNDADDEELAADIKEHGVLQPALVRPRGDRFELVFGARRYRGSKRAGLETLPCMVRELDDVTALELMIVENSKRSDVHPMEEAEGFEQLHAKCGFSVDDLAAKLGKSRGYVYARMKLLDLGPEARQAFYDGRLSASVALLVARVPAALQAEALKELDEEAKESVMHLVDAEKQEYDPIGARDAARILRNKYTLRLQKPPFDPGDPELVPAAGSCVNCPKRSGNQTELFADIPHADVCTDPKCFGEKRDAAAARVAAKLEAKGLVVIESKPTSHGGMRVPGGYVRPEDYCFEAGKTYGELAKPAKIAKKLDGQRVVMLDEKNKPVELLKKADVFAAAGVKEKKAAGERDWRAEQEKARRAGEVEQAAETAIRGALVEKIESAGKLIPALLRLLCLDAIGYNGRFIAWRRGWAKPDQFHPKFEGQLEKMTEKQLLGLLVEATIDERLEEACKLVGVDHKAIGKLAGDGVRAAQKAKADAKAAPPVPARDAKAMKRAAKKASKKKGGRK